MMYVIWVLIRFDIDRTYLILFCFVFVDFGNNRGFDSSVTKSDLKESAKTYLDENEMGQYWNKIDLLWHRIELFAKYGDQQKIKDDLTKCHVKAEHVSKIGKWFLDNIESMRFFLFCNFFVVNLGLYFILFHFIIFFS